MTLDNKTILITGGSKGIGRATAIKMAKKGMRIAINYNSSKEEAQLTAEEVIKLGGEAIILKADVADEDQVHEMVGIVLNKWKTVDILVNNAGIIKDSLLLGMSIDDWDRVINVDLRGTFLCTRELIRGMIRQKWGRVINVGSVVGIRGNAGQTNYSAAKAGVIVFTKALAKEVAARNITVNTITPGYIATDVVAVLKQSLKNTILSRIPQQKFGEANDIAEMITFLASDEASYITGQVISVDGGLAI